jgi:mannose-6-phosphate isomerase-like protein (cupin superfamily)
MQIFDLPSLLVQQQQSGRPYHEFLRVPEMSLGLYVLPAGGVDPQVPHTEAEAYYVVSGRAQVTVADAAHPVGPGSLVFVPAGVEHRFHDLETDLTLLVFFAPAEYTRAEATGSAA